MIDEEAARLFNLVCLAVPARPIETPDGGFAYLGRNGELVPVSLFNEAAARLRSGRSPTNTEQRATMRTGGKVIKAFVITDATPDELVEIGMAATVRFNPALPLGVLLDDGRVIDEQLHRRAVISAELQTALPESEIGRRYRKRMSEMAKNRDEKSRQANEWWKPYIDERDQLIRQGYKKFHASRIVAGRHRDVKINPGTLRQIQSL